MQNEDEKFNPELRKLMRERLDKLRALTPEEQDLAAAERDEVMAYWYGPNWREELPEAAAEYTIPPA